jgi:hypothetical protein
MLLFFKAKAFDKYVYTINLLLHLGSLLYSK